MTMKTAPYRLGLDIGTTSIGWAICPLDPKQSDEHIIVPCGVRIFPEGVEREKNKVTEVSKNQTRREKRALRRQHARRAMRREHLKHVLAEHGFYPSNQQEIQALNATNPYELRKDALIQALTPHQLGRVMLQMAKRRGFKSNRKAKKKEDGIVYEQTTELANKIREANAETLGAYLATCRERGEQIRKRYTLRSMLEQEFDLIMERQQPHIPALAELRTHFRRIVFGQRPLRSQKQSIGECSLEPGEQRCPLADWHAQQFRVLQEVNNLRIMTTAGAERALTDTERTAVLKHLFHKKDIKVDRLRRLLELGEKDILSIEHGKRAALKGNEVEAVLAKAFGKRWTQADQQRRDEVNQSLIDIEDPAELARTFVERFVWEDAPDVELPTGYLGFSKKAVLKLMPFMEAGLSVAEAIQKAGYSRPGAQSGCLDQLPLPAMQVNNPIVRRALFEVRKVVNAVVRKYGKPAEITVELAREARGSREARERYLNKIRENEANRTSARASIVELGVSQPSREDIERYQLWIEQNKLCPYTGKTIPASKLFTADIEVDHILPRSRSLDNSYMNKIVCFTSANRDKENRTPFEAFGTAPGYEDMIHRVSTLPYPKRRRFSQREIDTDKVIDRELNDTRYISRVVCQYLAQLGVPVRATRGDLTAQLRGFWSLNKILSGDGRTKARDDHRHHAVDAAVIAVTTRKLVQILTSDIAGRRTPRTPWKSFWEDVRDGVHGIVVSHRVARKISGALHMETLYGPTSQEGVYVARKGLRELTGAMVERIRDPAVKTLVLERCKACGVDPGQAGSKSLPKAVFQEPLRMPNGPEIKRVRILATMDHPVIIEGNETGATRVYEGRNNHHIEIVEVEGKKGKTRREGYVVSTMEALRRDRNKEPVICRNHGSGKRFLMSLSINEMLQVDDGPLKGQYVRVQKMDQNSRLVLRDHRDALSDTSGELRVRSNTLRAHKISVSPIGEVFPAND